MAKDNANQNAAQKMAVEPQVEVITQAKPAAQPALTATVDAAPIPVDEALVAVVPRKTFTSIRIGREWFSGLQGKRLMVPPGVRDHLKEKGLI